MNRKARIVLANRGLRTRAKLGDDVTTLVPRYSGTNFEPGDVVQLTGADWWYENEGRTAKVLKLDSEGNPVVCIDGDVLTIFRNEYTDLSATLIRKTDQ